MLHSLSVTATLYMSFTTSINLLCGLPPAWSPYIPPYLSSHCLLKCLLRPPPLPLFLPNSSTFSIGNLLACEQHWRVSVLTQALIHLIWKSHSWLRICLIWKHSKPDALLEGTLPIHPSLRLVLINWLVTLPKAANQQLFIHICRSLIKYGFKTPKRKWWKHSSQAS